MYLYHITDSASWDAAQNQGEYHAASLETEGFIHLSEHHQLKGVIERYFLNQTDLVLLEIDHALLQAEVRYEVVPIHGTFPHLYGVLNLDAVIRIMPFEPGQDIPS
jgi:uncharacterized protein (DUF952 family)